MRVTPCLVPRPTVAIFCPPLDDDDPPRQWLVGFGAAGVECPDDAAIESILNGDWMGGESVEEALVRFWSAG